jgi:hypothetical protein
MSIEKAIAGLAHSVLMFGQRLSEMIITHKELKPIKTRLRVNPRWTAGGALTEIGTIELEGSHETIQEAEEHIERYFCSADGDLGALINIILIAKGKVPKVISEKAIEVK